jgi:hypothetical protein
VAQPSRFRCNVFSSEFIIFFTQLVMGRDSSRSPSECCPCDGRTGVAVRSWHHDTMLPIMRFPE